MLRLILAGNLILALVVSSTHAADWPQFRGPNCTGIAARAKDLPVEFSQQLNVRWSVPLGDSIASPVIVAGRAFTTAMIDAETIGLLAFDAETGAPLWSRRWPIGDVDEIHHSNSYAAITPAADDERVYFYFSTLGMLAVDAATGRDIWQTEIPVPFFVFKWGAGMSPVLYQDLVLFVQDDDLAPAFYAFDKRTGAIRWQDDRYEMAVNYSHPVICTTDQGDEIVVAGTGQLIGYDPETGERLWYSRTLLRNIKTTPVCQDGVIYLSVQSGGIANQWLASVDRAETGNNDGKITREEIQAFVGKRPVPEAFFEKTFGRGDLNGDGVLEGEEIDRAFMHPDNFAGATYTDENPAAEYIIAVRGGGRGDVTDSHLLWKHPTRHTDHIVSPLILDDRMLLIKGGGIATCFETETGDLLYGPTRIRNGGNYFASPVFGDGKIYIAGENGHVVVLKNATTLEVLAVNDLGAPILGTPAIVGRALFVRTREALLRIELPQSVSVR